MLIFNWTQKICCQNMLVRLIVIINHRLKLKDGTKKMMVHSKQPIKVILIKDLIKRWQILVWNRKIITDKWWHKIKIPTIDQNIINQWDNRISDKMMKTLTHTYKMKFIEASYMKWEGEILFLKLIWSFLYLYLKLLF